MADARPVEERIDNSDFGLALLGFASGSMDALAFLNLRQVFPSAMTGNTALLGLALGQGNLVAASRPLVAFAGFLTAASAAAAGVDLWLDGCPVSRAVRWLLAVEACLLAMFAVAWQFSRPTDLRCRAVWSHRVGLVGDGHPKPRGTAGRSAGDHDRCVHEHADRHRDRGHGSTAATAAPADLRNETADRDVSDLWCRGHRRRSCSRPRGPSSPSCHSWP